MEIGKEFLGFISDYLKSINKNAQYGQIIKSAVTDLKSSNVLTSDFLFNLISISPEFIFSKVGSRTKEFKNQIEIWNPKNYSNIDSVEGVLSCHALSPMGDSIFLLSDLGRTMRVSAILDKKMIIMLADEEWSKYNWVASELGTSNLTRSHTWRKKDLYDRLGVEVDTCNLTNTPSKLTKHQIEEIGTAYEDLVRSIFGKEYIGRKLDREEANFLRSKYKLYSKNNPGIDFLNISLVKEKMKAEKEVIFNLLQTLRQFDQNTFIYYFTQRFHQYKYQNYLKIAVRSEKNFDLPFYELDSRLEKKGVNFSFYFENYKMYGDTFVIPYYFPSGSLYENKENLEFHFKETIMLNDSDNKEKIMNCFCKMNYPYNARLLSDLMSFAHFLMFPLNSNEKQSEYRSKIRDLSKIISNEFFKSWKFYVRPKSDFKKRVEAWSDNIFTSELSSKTILPYYYFPYVELKDGENIKRYGEYLSVLLREIIIITNHPLYHKS